MIHRISLSAGRILKSWPGLGKSLRRNFFRIELCGTLAVWRVALAGASGAVAQTGKK